MGPLLRKEFRSLLPFLGLELFFVLLNWAFLLLTEFPDQYPLSELLSEDSRSGSQLIAFIMALALAAGLLVREADEGTLLFLDALPLSRARIFGAKFSAALAVLWVLPLMELIYNGTFHALSRTSLDPEFRWDLLGTAVFLDAASCFIYLSLGLALSFARRFALLVLGLLFWGFVLLEAVEAPVVPFLDILSLGDPVFHGQRWLVPWTPLAVQLALSGLCVVIALAAFHFSGDGAARLAGKLQRTRLGTVAAGVGTGIVVLIWAGWAVYLAEREADSEDEPVHYEQWPTSRAATARYEFLYPENQGGLVNRILDRADDTEETVRRFLGGTPLEGIVVDMTTRTARHAGNAYWKKVRMNLPDDSANASVDVLLSVLGHETAHVYLEQLSDSRLHERFKSTRFFHEGLASYVEYRFFSTPEKLAALRRVAAVARARDHVRFEELLDDPKLTAARDRDLVYPLGELFVAALVGRYGDEAAGKVVRAFARPEAPKHLEGFALWQDTFQACGYNLSDITDGFYAALDREAAAHRSFIDRLPRLRGAVDQTAGGLHVRPDFVGPRPDGGQAVCRFRPRSDTPERAYETPWPADGVFKVSAARYAERSFWYQLGWRVPDASQVIYETWVEVRRGR